MESRVTNVLKNLRDKKEISIEQYKDLSPSGSRPGIMYGLAKVHKIVRDGLPSIRPILSAIGTPTYKLAKFLVPILEPLTTNEYTIKDSFTFAEDSLFRYKDSLQKKIRSDIVYRYMCSNCKVTYYGKTYRHFFTRAVEHMGISNLTGKRLKCVKQSAVSDHLLECNCSIDFDHFDILASDANKFRLLIKESLLIKRDQPQLNKTIKSFPLKLFD